MHPAALHGLRPGERVLFRRRLLLMPDKKQKFKDARKKYLAAIKDRSRALVKALVNRDDLEKYQSLIDKEEATRKAYYAAAEALRKYLHAASSVSLTRIAPGGRVPAARLTHRLSSLTQRLRPSIIWLKWFSSLFFSPRRFFAIGNLRKRPRSCAIRLN
jgi:hypothetical protein